MTTAVRTEVAVRRVIDLFSHEVAELAPQARRIDVRDAAELEGELGRALGAEHVPLESLASLCANWPRNQPLLLICRSGRRSRMAAEYLVREGFAHVFNLRGGMIAYTAAGLAKEPTR